jgi:hypothetical protein
MLILLQAMPRRFEYSQLVDPRQACAHQRREIGTRTLNQR